MYVIVTGNAFDGLAIWGPFDDLESAHEWAELTSDEWYCIRLASPK